jgi:hypothetical protein
MIASLGDFVIIILVMTLIAICWIGFDLAISSGIRWLRNRKQKPYPG